VTTATASVVGPGNNAILNVPVSCPGSTHAVGGGSSFSAAPTNGQQVALQESNPTGGSPATGWRVRYQQTAAGATVWSVTVYVICS
jgi:hypothetical protein